MSVDTLLDRLDGVKRIGKDRWLARCPAHDDRRASLSIRVADDGAILVHDFAGCSFHEVVAACGLPPDALFPSRATGHARRPERRPFPAVDVLRALEHEVAVVLCTEGALRNKESLSDADHARLLLAYSRIATAIAEAGYGC